MPCSGNKKLRILVCKLKEFRTKKYPADVQDSYA